MSDDLKTCVICGESCVGQARIKNAKGQYAHQACVQAKQQNQVQTEESAYAQSNIDEEPVGLEEDYGDALGGAMDDLFDGDNAIGMSDDSSAMACPNCGQRMTEGAVVCMSCGYNAQSGKSIKTRAKEQKVSSGKGMAALSGAANAGGFVAGPFVPLIGAMIGGAIGAAIWASISYFWNIEIGWVAWGIGALVGFGATAGSIESAPGAVNGAMAAVVAMASIVAGKYAASHFLVQDVFSTFEQPAVTTIADVDDDWFSTRVADMYCEELLADGGEIPWEDEVFIAAAVWPDEFPEYVQQRTVKDWNKMTLYEKKQYKKKIASESEFGGFTYKDVDDEWALQVLAEEVCEREIEYEQELDWPDKTIPIRVAEWPYDYPVSVRDAVKAKIEGMDEDEKNSIKEVMVADANVTREELASFTQDITQESFIQSFMHPFDLLFMFLAVVTAYGIAANEE